MGVCDEVSRYIPAGDNLPQPMVFRRSSPSRSPYLFPILLLSYFPPFGNNIFRPPPESLPTTDGRGVAAIPTLSLPRCLWHLWLPRPSPILFPCAALVRPHRRTHTWHTPTEFGMECIFCQSYRISLHLYVSKRFSERGATPHHHRVQ